MKQGNGFRTLCGQDQIKNGRRWRCARLPHPDSPFAHHYVSLERYERFRAIRSA